MTHKVFRACLLVTAFAALLLVPTIASATVFTLGQTTTMDVLLSGSSFLINGMKLDNWTGGSAVPPDWVNPINIYVTGILEGTSPGVLYQSGALSAGTGHINDITWAYDVHTVDGSVVITDNLVQLISFGATFDGQLHLSETVRNSAGTPIATKLVFQTTDPPPGVIVDLDQKFFTPVNFVHISKDLSLNGGTTANGQAFISDFKQTYSVIPEPASLVLVGIGLSALGLISLRKQK